MKNSTAILIFSRSSHTEAREKNFVDSDQNILIAKKFISSTIATAKATQLPVYFISEQNQNGDSFGERITNAFKNVFDNGFENVIAIGNDSPELNESHLIQAAEHLAPGNAVIGPSLDGGAYLIGINKKDFKPEQLKLLEWETSSLYDTIQAYFEVDETYCFSLKKLRDLDNEVDFNIFLNSSKAKDSLRSVLFCIINGIKIELLKHYSSLYFTPSFNGRLGLRAPPA